MKKSIKTSCVICGFSCDGKTLIKDENYCRPFEEKEGSACCPDCFKHYKDFDDVYLLKKIRRKLEGRKDEN